MQDAIPFAAIDFGDNTTHSRAIEPTLPALALLPERKTL